MSEETRQEVTNLLFTADDLSQYCKGGLEASCWANTPNPLPPLPANTPNSLQKFEPLSQKASQPTFGDSFHIAKSPPQKTFDSQSGDSSKNIRDAGSSNIARTEEIANAKKSGLIEMGMDKSRWSAGSFSSGEQSIIPYL